MRWIGQETRLRLASNATRELLESEWWCAAILKQLVLLSVGKMKEFLILRNDNDDSVKQLWEMRVAVSLVASRL